MVAALAALTAALAAPQVPATPQAARLLAVLELQNRIPEPERAAFDARYFADVVRSQALRLLPQLQVMTRENVLVLLQSAGKTLEECEGECEVDTGRRLGADLVVSGELLRVGKRFKLDLRLHETRTGRLLAGVQARGASVDELDEATAPAVRELFASLLPRDQPTPAPASTPAPLAPSVAIGLADQLARHEQLVALEKTGDAAGARALAKQIADAAGALAPDEQRVEGARVALAHARFALLQPEYLRFLAPEGPTADLTAWRKALDARAETLKTLLGGYTEVVVQGDNQWAVGAFVREAGLYAAYGDAFARAPVAEASRASMKEGGSAYANIAVQMLEQALGKARALRLEGGFAAEARALLQRLRPEHPLLR